MKRNERYLSFPIEIIDLVDERCSAKELYALILLRSKKYGYCYMTNQQFAEYFSTTARTVVNLLKKLKESNVIRVETVDKHHRRIYPLYTIKPQENIQEKNFYLLTRPCLRKIRLFFLFQDILRKEGSPRFSTFSDR